MSLWNGVENGADSSEVDDDVGDGTDGADVGEKDEALTYTKPSNRDNTTSGKLDYSIDYSSFFTYNP